MTEIHVGILDNERLFVKALVTTINMFNGVSVIADAVSGDELLQRLDVMTSRPDIILLDVEMPVMNGITIARELAITYPLIKLVALSVKDDDTTIIQMLKAGCCAYLLKDIHPNELEKALTEIYTKGYYNADAANINYRRLIVSEHKNETIKLSGREKVFLQLACSDLTYKQVAVEMHLAERTIDGYREAVFEKLNVQSRVGMAIEAIRRGLVTV